MSGGLGGGRFHNLKIKSLLLYQLSYQSKFMGRVGFEPTMVVTRQIKSLLPSANSAHRPEK